MTLRKCNTKKNSYTILKIFYTNNKDLIYLRSIVRIRFLTQNFSDEKSDNCE